jgi:signal transduction histidine kinase
MRCRLDLPPELPPIQFSAQVRHEILLSVKEAVNNAVRHSRATEVWFRLKLGNHELALSVEDNGIGFNPGTAARGGNGLKNMRSRLESLGGSCTIGPGSGGGTTVCFSIPIAAGQLAKLLK